jgi:hypothetical protein
MLCVQCFEKRVSGEAMTKLFEARAHCRFLFGKDVNEYLDQLHRDFGWLASFTNDVIDQRSNRNQLIDEKYKRIERIIDFYTTGAPLFLEYLRLDMKVKYFWPFPSTAAPLKDPKSDQKS